MDISVAEHFTTMAATTQPTTIRHGGCVKGLASGMNGDDAHLFALKYNLH